MNSYKFIFFFIFHKLRRLLGLNKKPNSKEIKFCLENGINPADIQTNHVFGIFGFFKNGSLTSQLHALVVPKRKRFGNALLQLADAYNIAQHLGVRKIYHRGYSFLNDTANVDGIHFIKGVPQASENYLIGDFYQNKVLLDLCTKKTDRWKIVNTMSEHINLNLNLSNKNAGPDDKNSLYIHLRSGDIFKKTPPHQDYGQPPLAFYKKIISLQKWTKVYLVYEDNLNPVIPALTGFLIESKINHQTFSGDIHHDIEILLQAKNLVIARGTFIYPILCISKNIKQVFYFEIDEHSLWGLQNSPIKFHKYIDLASDYRSTILREWKNDAAQCALMIDYPETNISIS